MTTENWNNVLFQNMPQFYKASQATYSYAIVSLYLISWMFIGTFVLLNLFLAIIVDAFLSQDVGEKDD
jgi:Ion transport protein